jgi:hypothetical protein
VSRSSFRRLYLLVILLHLVSDVALSPFYPQLFERLFGVTDPAATGVYIWVCRVTALVAMPLWGLIARRFSLSTLVLGSLGAAAVLELALAVSPTYPVFLVVSAVQVAVTMAFTLAYPAFVGTGTDRVRDVTVFAYVINGGTVVATLIGAGIMALPQPRWGIAACALLYVALAVLCHRRLPRERRAPAVVDAAEAAGPRSATPRGAVAAIAAVSAIVLAVEIARLIVRPFFTLYAEDGRGGPPAAPRPGRRPPGGGPPAAAGRGPTAWSTSTATRSARSTTTSPSGCARWSRTSGVGGSSAAGTGPPPVTRGGSTCPPVSPPSSPRGSARTPTRSRSPTRRPWTCSRPSARRSACGPTGTSSSPTTPTSPPTSTWPAGWPRCAAPWGDYMRGDDAANAALQFPFLRRRGPLLLIGVSTAVPTAPFMATGHLGQKQLADLAARLAEHASDVCFRVLLIHHPLRSARWHKRLTDADDLLALLPVNPNFDGNVRGIFTGGFQVVGKRLHYQGRVAGAVPVGRVPTIVD